VYVLPSSYLNFIPFRTANVRLFFFLRGESLYFLFFVRLDRRSMPCSSASSSNSDSSRYRHRISSSTTPQRHPATIDSVLHASAMRPTNPDGLSLQLTPQRHDAAETAISRGVVELEDHAFLLCWRNDTSAARVHMVNKFLDKRVIEPDEPVVES